MAQQVVTIGPNGELSGLQHKPNKGLDLRQFGKAEIKRASEIVWDENHQKWYVQILDGTFAGLPLCLILAVFAGMNVHNVPGKTADRPEDLVFLFDDYDDAVRAEIDFLDRLRLKGAYL